MASILVIIISAAIFFWKGPNIGIDFAGGFMIEATYDNEKYDVETIRNLISDMNYEGAVVYSSSKNTVVIKIKATSEGKGAASKLQEELTQKYDLTYQRVDFIGANVSHEMIRSGILAIICSFMGVAIYIYLRFNPIFAFSAVIGIIHDIVVLLCFFLISQIEFTISSIAAILTIIGYSINDTVVIFDRIRRQLRINKGNNTVISAELLNNSISMTLSRTIITSVTTLIAAAAMILLSRGELRNFSTVIFFGVTIGTYSSIFIVPYFINITERYKKSKK
ncbi:protein translocase subunit SecF [Anaplasmataceae bacterium AB001_6]|nr:protein translocase subunit SecF [Anaplasmataceae bacterium AB001_6]